MKRSIGKFKIPRHTLEDDFGLVKKIMSECVVINAEANFYEDCIEYTAIHDTFSFVLEGCVIPYYRIECVRPKNGHVKFMFWD